MLQSMFPLKCANAKYNQTTYAMKSHSRALARFQI